MPPTYREVPKLVKCKNSCTCWEEVPIKRMVAYGCRRENAVASRSQEL